MAEITIDTDDVTSLAGWALSIEMAPQAVGNWRSRYADFPDPLLVVGTTRLYSKATLNAWLEGVRG